MCVRRLQQRSDLLERKRQRGPPRVVAFLPLSAQVDVQSCWDTVLRACAAVAPAAAAGAGKAAADGMDVDAAGDPAGTPRP